MSSSSSTENANFTIELDKESLKSYEVKSNRLDTSTVNVSVKDYLTSRTPEETKKSTNQAVCLYETIMKETLNIEGKTFKTLLESSVEELPDLLARFFIVAKKKDGLYYNASSLETFFQSLARFLANEYTPKIDIKKDINFKIVLETVSRRCTEVSELGARPGINTARAVEESTLKLAYEKGSLGRSNPRALIATVPNLMMTGFGCRACKEVYAIQNQDLMSGPDDKNGLPKWIELSERITKMRRGRKSEVRDVEGRVYLDNENPEVCPVRTLVEYKRRRNEFQNQVGNPFMWTVKQSAQANPSKEPFWYTNGRMGVNQIGKLYQNAFLEVGVNIKAEKIKATSCRKNLVQHGADSLVPGVFISKMTGQKNLDTKLGYLENKEKTHQAASLVIQRKSCGVVTSNFPTVLDELTENNQKRKTNEEDSILTECNKCPKLSEGPMNENVQEPVQKVNLNNFQSWNQTVYQTQPSSNWYQNTYQNPQAYWRPMVQQGYQHPPPSWNQFPSQVQMPYQYPIQNQHPNWNMVPNFPQGPYLSPQQAYPNSGCYGDVPGDLRSIIMKQQEQINFLINKNQ